LNGLGEITEVVRFYWLCPLVRDYGIDSEFLNTSFQIDGDSGTLFLWGFFKEEVKSLDQALNFVQNRPCDCNQRTQSCYNIRGTISLAILNLII